MRSQLRQIIGISLVALFTLYNVSLTLTLHAHWYEGKLHIHAHPSATKGHTHKYFELVQIDLQTRYSLLKADIKSFIPIGREILYVVFVEKKTTAFQSPSLELFYLRGPPFLKF